MGIFVVREDGTVLRVDIAHPGGVVMVLFPLWCEEVFLGPMCGAVQGVRRVNILMIIMKLAFC